MQMNDEQRSGAQNLARPFVLSSSAARVGNGNRP